MRKLWYLLCLLLMATPVAAQSLAPAFSQDQTRPLFVIALAITGAFAIWNLSQTISIGWQGRDQIVWRVSLVMVGVIPVVATAGMLAVGGLIGNDPTLPFITLPRIVELIIPVAIGMQAAFLFSPDDEPALEVLMACPRPLAWLLMERFGVVILMQGALGLFATLIIVQQTDMDVLTALLRWIPPSLMLAGAGMFITMRSRNAVLGLLMTGLLWLALALFASAFIPGQPIFSPFNYIQPFGWGIHPYMQPEYFTQGDYLLNRGLVTALGLLLMWFAVKELQNTEKILLGSSSK